MENISKIDVLNILEKVKDPEIDTVSIIDLGMVENVEVNQEEIKIEMLPTFLGCPALEIIKKNVENTVKEMTSTKVVTVQFLTTPSWTSDRVTEKGKEGLKKFGIAPPSQTLDETGMWEIHCPYCNSKYVNLENLFGPTACRSILYCKSCKNPFEAMKPLIQN